MSLRARIASASLVVIIAACATSPHVTTMSLPAPLVTALISDRGTATRPAPAYVVSSLPPRYPLALVPSKPAIIVGGMTNGDEIVAVFADSTRRLAAVLEELFVSRGFTRPAPTPGSGFMRGGGPYTFFCLDSATIAAEPLTGANRSLVRVTYRVVRGQRMCPTADPSWSDNAQLHIPELTPPAGVRVGISRGGNGEGASSSTELSGTDLVPASILAHYAAQLSAAGWTASAPAISERVAAEYFSAKDARGIAWDGVLMAVGNGTAVTASLSMHVRGK